VEEIGRRGLEHEDLEEDDDEDYRDDCLQNLGQFVS
jgi:hypothetical protein